MSLRPSLAVGRRRLLLAGAGAWLTAARVLAAPMREIGWNELVPRGWDAQQGLRALPPELDSLDDADPRAKALLAQLRATWDNAPAVPALTGSDVKLPGYMVPLKAGKAGVQEFLLVPYLGACIHSPPPPANQIVVCLSPRPLPGLRLMEALWVEGRLRVERRRTPMGVAAYVLQLADARRQL